MNIVPGKRTSARVKFGTLILHVAEVKISTELGAEFNIWYRCPQLVAEVTRAEHRYSQYAIFGLVPEKVRGLCFSQISIHLSG